MRIKFGGFVMVEPKFEGGVWKCPVCGFMARDYQDKGVFKTRLYWDL